LQLVSQVVEPLAMLHAVFRSFGKAFFDRREPIAEGLQGAGQVAKLRNDTPYSLC
jgi:hypothetical protein